MSMFHQNQLLKDKIKLKSLVIELQLIIKKWPQKDHRLRNQFKDNKIKSKVLEIMHHTVKLQTLGLRDTRVTTLISKEMNHK